MEYRRLGRTDLMVSRLCLGTMTWGRQNSEAEGHAQMDEAVARGINFFDTAEMYAVPPTAETYGTTERILGSWFAARRDRRERVVLATKVVGPGPAYIRDGRPRLDRANIRAAVEASLTRLRTDRIDLYQLHWPDRTVNSFGKLGLPDLPADEAMTHPAETLDALDELVREGKIRHVGVSNETPWGLMTFLHLAETRGLPRLASIQNPYSLLNRTFEVGLAECALREEVGLLAYSPLGGGTLTGKYLDGALPPGSRRAIDSRKSRYATPRGEAATRAYVEIARKHGLDPAQMAIAYVLGRPFVTSVILGATSLDQLKTDMAAAEVRLPAEALVGIEAVHAANPNPCP